MVVINQFYIQFTCPLRVFTCLRAYLFTCLLVSFAAMEFKTKPSQKFDLPKRIARLGELAYNLWWTWQPEAARLLENSIIICGNASDIPIRLLQEIARV